MRGVLVAGLLYGGCNGNVTATMKSSGTIHRGLHGEYGGGHGFKEGGG
jgi:hypothetical protein